LNVLNETNKEALKKVRNQRDVERKQRKMLNLSLNMICLGSKN